MGFVFAMMLVLVVLIAVPETSLVLPRALGYQRGLAVTPPFAGCGGGPSAERTPAKRETIG
jgi:hypothetical protein